VGLNALGLGFLFQAKDLASGVMADVKSHLHELGEEGAAVAEGVGSSFKSFGSGLAIMAAGIEGLSKIGEKVEIAEHFGDAVKLASNRVNEAEFPMQSMTAIVDQLGAKFGVLPVDEMNAMSAAIGAGGRDAAKAQALLTAGNQMALATGTDLKMNISAVSGVIRAFNMDMKDSVKVGDAMFAASRHVEDGLQGMSTMLTVLSPTAVQANMTSNELLATIAQMSAAGIEGRHGMMGLREILTTLINPSQEARVEAARLGIAFDRATLQSEGLPGVLNAISSSGRMNAQSLEKLFGSTSAASVAMALMRDGGGQLKNMMDEVTNSTDAAAAAAEKMVHEDKRFENLRSTLDRMIGETLLPLKEALYGLGASFLESFTKGNPALVHFITWLAFGASALAVVLGAGLAITAAWPIIAAAFGMLAEGAVAAAGAMLAAIWPFVLVAAAVGLAIWALKVAFDHNFGGIADTVHKVWDDVSLVFTALEELFSGGGFTEDTWAKLEAHSGIRDFAIAVFGWVSRIENFFSHIGTAFEENLGFLKPMFEMIGTAIDDLIDAFAMLSGPQGAGGASDAFDAFGDAGEVVGDILSGVFMAVLLAIQIVIAMVVQAVGIVVGVVDAIKDVFSGLLDFFSGFFEFFSEVFQGHWGKAWHGMKLMVFGVVDAIIGVLLSLVGIVGGVVDSIAAAFGQKTTVQKSINDFRDYTHNEMAKSFGVADATGLRTITTSEANTSDAFGSSVQPAEPPRASFRGPSASMAPDEAPWSPGATGGGSVAGADAQAATAAAARQSSNMESMTSHLEQIAKNTEGGGTPVNVTVMLDSEAIGKAVSKAKKSSETRNFTPDAIYEE
jgi:TP901 family phage tail tape measure protein